MWFAIAAALTLELLDTSLPLPFELGDDGAIVVPVRVDGQGPFRFLFDTGASQSLIAEAAARRLGASPQSRTVMVTPSGHRMLRPVVKLSRVEVGPVVARNLAVTVLHDNEMPGPGRVAGIIGQDVLGPLVYTIDYRTRTIAWHREVPGAGGTRVRLQVERGRFLALLPQSADDVPLRMIPDTGADGLVLFARAGRKLPPMTPLDILLLRTVSGQRLGRRVLLDDFRAGDLRLQDQVAALVPRADADAVDGDGLLPLHIFSRVTFNGPEGYLAIVP